ncbi:MAG: PAS domain S-box protein, partial [Syntrophaceae bacterium]
PSGMWAIVRDISERKRAEEALRKSEEKYRRIIDTANEGIWIVDADLRTNFVNARLAEMIGYRGEEMIGQRFESFLFEEDLADHEKRIEARREGASDHYERRLRHKDGHAVLVLLSATPILDNEGHFQGSFAMITDITERKRTEVELQKLASVIMHCSELVNLATPDWKMTYLNEAGIRMLGISADELEGMDIKQVIPDHLMEKVRKEVLPAMAAGGWEGELEYKNLKTGALTAVYATIFLVKDPKTGVPLYHANVSLDISARKQGDQALKESLELLADAERIGRTGSWKMDVSRNEFTLSAGMRRIMGFTEQETITFESIQSRLYPDELDDLLAKWRQSIDKRSPFTAEYRVLLPDGTIRYTVGTAEALCDSQGEPLFLHGSIQDITERRALEDELIKAQKLDSIGTLAGGLAHDYNNLLTAIMGNMELAKVHAGKNHQAQAYLAKAQEAALTARDLTRQLITFSQGGYPQGEVMPVQELLTESVRLVLSGSNTRTSWRIADDLPEVKIDANQIRQVIHNIVINAQEAMPQGGTLLIEADKIILGPDNPLHLAEGVYIRMVFRDEGRGIKAENLPKVFDPYFTTKDLGQVKGMGLGLSICYSIIKRHGGHIIVDSTFGIGTTVALYLPKGYA